MTLSRRWRVRAFAPWVIVEVFPPCMSTEFWQTLAQLALVIVLMLLNGFFVASEYSLVAVRRSRVEQMIASGDPRARWVAVATENLNLYISATQVGITIVSLILGSLGEPVVVRIVAPLFGWLPPQIGFISASTVAFVIAFFLVTYLTIVIGELIPKRIAIRTTERVALVVVGPLRVVLAVFRPFIWLLNGTANVLLRLLGLGGANEHSVYSAGELRILLRESEQEGVLEQGERELIDRAFTFADKEAEQVMVPRTQIRGVALDTRVVDVAPQVATSVYTRFPVYEENIDTIRGMVHVKDVLAATGSGRGEQTIGAIMRPVLTVPQSVHIDDLMREMRRKHTHMAVLVDDYGGTAGIVTMEDLIEELVGDIEDEFDPAGFTSRRNADGSYTLDGRTPITDAKQLLSIENTNGDYETLAGYVLAQAGRIPRAGETIELPGFLVHVDRMDRFRIAQVTIHTRDIHNAESATIAAD